MTNAIVRVPALERRRGGPARQRPGGVHARRRVHPRARPTSAASGSRPASARTASRAQAGWASSSPSGSSRACRASTSGRWTRAASARTTRAGEYTLARTLEVYSTYYDVKYPGHERQAGRPLRLSPTYSRLQELGRGVRREVRLGAAELVRAERRRRRRVAAPARLGGPPLVARDRRPSTGPCGRPPRSSTRRRSPRSRSPGAGAADFLERLCDNRVARDDRRESPTRRCSTRAAGSSATSPSRGSPRSASASSPAQRSAGTTSPGSPPMRPRTARSLVEDVTSRYACLGIWGPRARDILAAADDGRSLERRVPVHARAGARGRAGAVPRAPRDLRRRAGLGALLPDASSACALWDTIWAAGPRPRPPRGRLPRDRLVPAREGLPRLGRRHHARGHALGGRARLRRQARQGRLHRPRGAARQARAGAEARLPRPRRPARRRARLRARPARRRHGRPRHERRLRLHGRALDRLRLRPRGRRGAGTAGRGRDLRRVDRRRGRARAVVRPGRVSRPFLALAAN